MVIANVCALISFCHNGKKVLCSFSTLPIKLERSRKQRFFDLLSKKEIELSIDEESLASSMSSYSRFTDVRLEDFRRKQQHEELLSSIFARQTHQIAIQEPLVELDHDVNWLGDASFETASVVRQVRYEVDIQLGIDSAEGFGRSLDIVYPPRSRVSNVFHRIFEGVPREPIREFIADDFFPVIGLNCVAIVWLKAQMTSRIWRGLLFELHLDNRQPATNCQEYFTPFLENPRSNVVRIINKKIFTSGNPSLT